MKNISVFLHYKKSVTLFIHRGLFTITKNQHLKSTEEILKKNKLEMDLINSETKINLNQNQQILIIKISV